MPLTEEKRIQLDGIVQQMSQNNESDENVQAVVNDFKSKYEVTDTRTTGQKIAGAISPYARPVLELGGATVGGIVAAPANIVAPGVSEALGVAGGYAAGKGAANLLEEYAGTRKPPTPIEALSETGQNVKTGLEMGMVGPVIGTTLSSIYKGGEKYINNIIDWGIKKGLRPSVAGKATSEQFSKYMERARESVKTIIAHKNDLVLSDEIGNIVKGELPKNLKQFSEAISQVKRKIFSQYDQMAGGAGNVTVELNSIANELNLIANNKVLMDSSPSVATYAGEKAKALMSNVPQIKLTGKIGNVPPQKATYTTIQAQDAIAHLNNALEAFYKNPTYENASKASIDAMIANRMRKGLDTAIQEAVGPGYQELKNTYGALSTIEKDVTHRAIVDSRRNIKGLIDFSDIFSGSEVIRGILTMNPATVGTGAAAKTISSLYKHWNNPNRIVNSMFGDVERSLTRQPRVSEQTGNLIGRTGAYIGLSPRMQE